MRARQRATYADRIERVVARLGQVGDDEPFPGLEELAAVAALSPFHFHRVFRLMTGETVGQLVRRIRLARGLPALVAAEGSVTEAAGLSGYATSQSFARALKGSVDLSPNAARRSEAAAMALHAALARGPSAAGADRPPLSIELVSVDPFQLVAIRNVGDYSQLDRAFERLFAMVFSTLEIERLAGIYGVPLDDPGTVPVEKCRFDCALRLDGEVAAPEGTRLLELGGGIFVRQRHLGSYDRIHETIDRLYRLVIAGDGVGFADVPLHVHYVDDPEEVAEAHLRSDIYLPVEDAGR